MPIDDLPIARQDGERGTAHRMAVHYDKRSPALSSERRHARLQLTEHTAHARQHLDEALCRMRLPAGRNVWRCRLDQHVLREVE